MDVGQGLSVVILHFPLAVLVEAVQCALSQPMTVA